MHDLISRDVRKIMQETYEFFWGGINRNAMRDRDAGQEDRVSIGTQKWGRRCPDAGAAPTPQVYVPRLATSSRYAV